MKKEVFFRGRYIAVILAAIIAAAGFSACTPVRQLSNAADVITQDFPTADNTLTSMLQIKNAMYDAMSNGETEMTFNIADIDENELMHIGDNMSSFWGKPVKFSVNNLFKSVDGIVPGRTVDIRNVTNYFELSSNYYVYDFIKNGVPVPDGMTYAKQIADKLPGIAAEIFTDPSASDFDKTLAAHDWLITHIEYDDSTPGISEENGSYGALVLGRTMCQGYAQSLELLLKCYTDIEIVQIVGEALNVNDPPPADPETAPADSETAPDGTAADTQNSGGGDAAPADQSAPQVWGGHAWNAVKLDGAWYQIDTTFNDPRGNTEGSLSHFYFGQTDDVMSANHRWEKDFFPVSDTENFLFFRNKGLFAENWDAFQSMFSDMLAESPLTSIEIAIQGAKIDENNIQFIYKIRPEIEEFRWSEQEWNDICVNSIELVYS